MDFKFISNVFKRDTSVAEQKTILKSSFLQRDVRVDILYPKSYSKFKKYPIIIFNDGQDFPALGIKETLSELYKTNLIPKIFIVGIHCNENRINEYGVAGIPDYANRGNKAAEHSKFIIQELLPHLRYNYPISAKKEMTMIAGFSLGGLSAFDIAWNHASVFSKVGVFSGALWWRSQKFTEDNPDGHRIVHEMVQRGKKRDGLKFWFQTGTKDEDADRNNNGVIDAIDDTLDLIQCLRDKGYGDNDFSYVEIEDGEHNPQTWGEAMLAFLTWAV
jgi:enterochelin esterase-like enzyme